MHRIAGTTMAATTGPLRPLRSWASSWTPRATSKVESIQDRTLGLMIAELLGTSEQTQAAMNYLADHQLQVEVLGYVQRND